MDGQIRKRRTLEAIKRILLRESLNQPLMVIFEDLHWIDEATQDFLNLSPTQSRTRRYCCWSTTVPNIHISGIEDLLHAAQARSARQGIGGGDAVGAARRQAELAALKQTIIERTEGNPFFMEETVQVLLDEGALVRDGAMVKLTKPIGELKIPPTVQGILAARIDRLPADAKELLQTLAVIGREFPLSLIRAVVAKSDERTQAAC